MRFYHLDVWADLGTDRLTWRRLAVLLRHLPRESAYVQAVGGDTVRWGDSEHLLAGILDVVQIGNFYTQVLASDRRLKGDPKPPKPLERPGDRKKRAKASRTVAQIAGTLEAWREGRLEMTETTTSKTEGVS